MFDLHPDGQRFALWPMEQTFIFNFFDELRRIAPVKK